MAPDGLAAGATGEIGDGVDDPRPRRTRVVVPHTIEQAVNANRIEQLQAGLYVEPTAVSAARLRQAAQQVLDDPDLQNGIEKIGQSFCDAGGVPRAVTAIHHLQQRHGLR